MKNYLPAMAALLMVVGASGARAESAQERHACMGDALTLCTYAIPNRHHVFACLRANIDDLSPACHAVIAHYARPRQPSTVGSGNPAGSDAGQYRVSHHSD